MKADLNIFAVIFVSKIALLIGFYRLLSGHHLEIKLFRFIYRRLAGIRQRRVFTLLVTTLVLSTPFALINYAVDLIWIFIAGKWSLAGARTLMSWNLNKYWYFLLLFGLTFILIQQVAKRSKRQHLTLVVVALGAMSIIFTLAENQVGKFNDNPIRAELPAGAVRSGIEEFLSGTIYSAVPLTLTSHPSKNAAAGPEGIMVTSALIEALNGKELNSIIAHEIGHLNNKDNDYLCLVFLGLLISPWIVYAGTGFWNIFRRRELSSREHRFRISLPAAAMLFLAFVLPARLFWSQFIRSAEYAADSYAVAYLHEKNIEPRVMIGALSRTSPDITEPTLATYLLFFDHPTLAQRSENIERTCRRLSTGK